MSLEDNKAVVRRFLHQIFDEDDLAAADDLLATDYILHERDSAEPLRGIEAYKRRERDFRQAFSERAATVLDQVAEGDRVATRWTLQVTNSGPYEGRPASGRRVTLNLVSFSTVRGGRIVEEWEYWDPAAVQRQLPDPVA